jgi:nitroreductase
MDFEEIVRKRRMVRHFRDEPIPEAVLLRILDLARHGPSAGYCQGQDFILVTDQEARRAIAQLAGEESYVQSGFHPFISGAPALIVPCTNEAAYHRRYREADKLMEDGSEIDWPVPYWFMDGGCAVMIILLGAVNAGLAAGFAEVWDLDALRRLLDIPEEVMPLGVIPLGYPAPDKRSLSLKRGRRPVENSIHLERW